MFTYLIHIAKTQCLSGFTRVAAPRSPAPDHLLRTLVGYYFRPLARPFSTDSSTYKSEVNIGVSHFA
ncbi:hypothetical protein Ac2012v2_005675 [Leucoagaricus gongylophorus]